MISSGDCTADQRAWLQGRGCKGMAAKPLNLPLLFMPPTPRCLRCLHCLLSAFDLEFYTDMTNISEVLGTLPGTVPSTDDPGFEGAVEDGGEGEGEVARCGEESEEVGCDPEDPSAATQSRSARFLARFQRLNHALCELVQDYALVSFTPLAVTVSCERPCSP